MCDKFRIPGREVKQTFEVSRAGINEVLFNIQFAALSVWQSLHAVASDTSGAVVPAGAFYPSRQGYHALHSCLESEVNMN
eukprot:1750537-Amphidinium_carterae.1